MKRCQIRLSLLLVVVVVVAGLIRNGQILYGAYVEHRSPYRIVITASDGHTELIRATKAEFEADYRATAAAAAAAWAARHPSGPYAIVPIAGQQGVASALGGGSVQTNGPDAVPQDIETNVSR